MCSRSDWNISRMECKVDIKAKNDKKDADWNISRMECKAFLFL